MGGSRGITATTMTGARPATGGPPFQGASSDGWYRLREVVSILGRSTVAGQGRCSGLPFMLGRKATNRPTSVFSFTERRATNQCPRCPLGAAADPTPPPRAAACFAQHDSIRDRPLDPEADGRNYHERHKAKWHSAWYVKSWLRVTCSPVFTRQPIECVPLLLSWLMVRRGGARSPRSSAASRPVALRVCA